MRVRKGQNIAQHLLKTRNIDRRSNCFVFVGWLVVFFFPVELYLLHCYKSEHSSGNLSWFLASAETVLIYFK